MEDLVIFNLFFFTTETLSSQSNTEISPVQLSVIVPPWFNFKSNS